MHVGDSVMIVSVPTELDNDHMEVMKIAQQTQQQQRDDAGALSSCGMVMSKDIMDETGWDKNRTDRALDLLLGKGMAWLDIHKGLKMYWFPR